MTEAWVVSNILLWVVVISLAVVCFALIRQVGILYERIAPAGALAMNRRLSGGDTAPTFAITALDGKSVSIGQANTAGSASTSSKSQLLFFLSPSCPVCKTLLPIVKSIQRREQAWLDIIFASDGDDKQLHQMFIQKHKLDGFPYVLSQPLGMAYGISKLPYAVLIDEEGMISALGMVNSREHLESLFEAKLLGKHTIQDYLDDQVEGQIDDDSHQQTAVGSSPVQLFDGKSAG